MQRSNSASKHWQKPLVVKLKKAENQLGIEKIDALKDHLNRHLILLASGNQMDCSDVYAFVKGSRLILEATMPLYHGDLPFRTHLLGEEIFDDYTVDEPNIGFSEIILNPEFHYQVLSYAVLNPGLVKVVLNYRNINKHKKVSN